MAKSCSSCDWFSVYDYTDCANVPTPPGGRCMAAPMWSPTGERVEKTTRGQDVCDAHAGIKPSDYDTRFRVAEALGVKPGEDNSTETLVDLIRDLHR